jgi:GNAT superfamily N-acetyltransferase
VSRQAPLVIRRAEPGEADALTDLCRAAKRHWGYPPEWMEAWAEVLRITPAAIAEQWIYVAEQEGHRVGFYGLRREGPRWHLEHLWLEPAAIGRGHGRTLFAAAATMAQRLGARALHIKADPNAEAFYRKMGAVRRDLEAYDLLGTRRELPLMVYPLPK